jgi:FRG domain
MVVIREYNFTQFAIKTLIRKSIRLQSMIHTRFSALSKQGKRLPTLEEYARHLLPLDFETDNAIINQSGAVTDTNPDSVVVVQTSPHHFGFMPGPEFCPRLYRGQNEYHDLCFPSLYREQEPIDIIYRTAKWIELSYSLSEHPAFLWLRGLEIEGLKFGFNFQAVAQHYGFHSALLDFSRSRDVAMFFAICEYDKKANKYYPRKSGKAVLYTIDLREMILENDPKSVPVTLGLEPLPRPEAQKAFGVQLLPGQNLNNKSWSRSAIFEFTKQEADRCYEMFDGGRALFPSSPFDDHIEFLRGNDAIPKLAIEHGIEIGLIPRHSLGIDAAASELESVGYNVIEEMHTIDSNIMTAALDDWSERGPAFFDRIRFRGRCDHFQA